MANSPALQNGPAPVHKGTDKWFAIGDELAALTPSADTKTTSEHAAVQRTLRLRKTLIVGLAMLPIAVVAIALLVATVRRHLAHAGAAPAIAAAAATVAVPAPGPAPAAAPADPPPAASRATASASSNHPSRAHRSRVRPKRAATRKS